VQIEVISPGLQRVRKARGLTQEKLAESLGLSRDSIAELEAGLVHPEPFLRRILMAYFDCRFEDLFHVTSVSNYFG
jgi:DNA-binding XRE family transcriptional regulator